MSAKTIGIKLRYDDFKIATRDQTIEHFTADAKTIRPDRRHASSACSWIAPAAAGRARGKLAKALTGGTGVGGDRRVTTGGHESRSPHLSKAR